MRLRCRELHQMSCRLHCRNGHKYLAIAVSLVLVLVGCAQPNRIPGVATSGGPDILRRTSGVKAAIDAGDVRLLETALASVGNPNQEIPYGNGTITVLAYAILKHKASRSYVEVLCARGASAAQSGTFPPLHAAVYMGSTAVLKYLLARVAPSELNQCVDLEGNAALHYACVYGRLDMVSILLSHGADVSAKNRGGATPMLLAYHSGRLGVVTALVAAGASITSANDRGESLLHHSQDQSVIQYAIRHGASVDARNQDGNTPLHLQCLRSGALKSPKLVEVLVKAGADVNAINKRGQTPAHLCCYGDGDSLDATLGTLGILANAKADFALRDVVGQSLLHYAMAYDLHPRPRNKGRVAWQMGVVRFLLKMRIPLNDADKDGNTPLHLAALHAGRNVYDLLLAAGARDDIKNTVGRTPREYLEQWGK